MEVTIRFNGRLYVIEVWKQGNESYPIAMDVARTYDFANARAWAFEREFNGATYQPTM